MEVAGGEVRGGIRHCAGRERMLMIHTTVGPNVILLVMVVLLIMMLVMRLVLVFLAYAHLHISLMWCPV